MRWANFLLVDHIVTVQITDSVQLFLNDCQSFSFEMLLVIFRMQSVLVWFDAEMDSGVLRKIAGVGEAFVALGALVGLGLSHMDLSMELQISFGSKHLEKNKEIMISFIKTWVRIHP